ncbi:hypothetical protein CMEL01_03148 [Colletotrichum melonis]|uniref:Clr5 domain-containing protein n=1 Tax=Colletotrichum melonis TaxID=1209925 RepID=A0AAI9XU12_9PEZI|nr:hypothetical protein CMEL01_03148 [Colletotrichum melonis]
MSAIQWESWNDEITQLYVTEDRSAEETIKALNQRHRLRITIKQFKKRYSGLKKVRANEWRAIKREMQKQKDAGKECLIFLNGRQLEPERVAREMRRYSGIRGRDVEDGGVPIDIGIDTAGLHRLELRTKNLPSSDALPDTGSSISRLPFTADVTHVAGSCGPNSTNVNSSSTEVNCFSFDHSDMNMDTSCFTELLFQKSPRNTPPPSRSGRGVVDGSSEGTILAISQRPSPRPEYFIPDFGVSDLSMALKSRSEISARFWKMLNGMALNISQVNHFMKALKRDIGTFASKVDQIRWPSWWQELDSVSGWIILASGDPSLLLLKPIYFIAGNVLRRSETGFEYHDNAGAKDCQIALCQDQRLLNLFFSAVLHLICNNMAGISSIPSFLQWVTRMNVLDRLAMYLKINSGDADALLEAAVCRLNLGLSGDSQLFSWETEVDWLEQLIEFFDKNGLGLSKEVSSLLLHALARVSKISSARSLLAHGADINVIAPIRHGFVERHSRHPVLPLGPPLLQAIYSENFDMAEFLIEEGCGIDRCYRGNPPELLYNALSISISERPREPRFADLLLQKGAQIHPSIKIDLQPLQASLEHVNDGEYPILRQWIRHHLPLIDIVVQAAAVGSLELSRILSKHNILQETALECALRRAVKMKNALAVQTLLQRGVNPNPPPCQIECSKLLGIDEDLVGLAPICLINNTDLEQMNITFLLLRADADAPRHILIDMFRADTLLPSRGGDLLLLYSLLGSSVLATPAIGATALTAMVRTGSLMSVSYLLDHKAPLNYHGAHRMSCLQQAASRGDLLLTRYLLEHGADVNFAAHEDGGRTALQCAVESRATTVAECLLSAGADVRADPAKKDGVTVLEALAKSEGSYLYTRFPRRKKYRFPAGYKNDRVSELSRFRYWVAMGAPVNRPNGDDGRLLHYLILHSNYKCLQSALELGAMIEARCQVSEYGDEDEDEDENENRVFKGAKTPLQLAAHSDEVEAARLLLEYGADINAYPSDEYGRTALQAATCNSGEHCGRDMLQLLFSFDPDINALPSRKGGLTALQGAAISGDLGVAKMLLERGADINAPAAAEDGRTAIEGAAEHGRLDMVEFLLENGAKGDPETGFSRAIELAEAEVHFGVAKVLREHVAMSALLDFDLAHVESSDLIGPLPSPGFVFSDEAMEGFNFEMPS